MTRFKTGDAVCQYFHDQRIAGRICGVVPERAAALKPPIWISCKPPPRSLMVGLTHGKHWKERAPICRLVKGVYPAGSGGIGTFAIQFAKLLRAKVGTTVSTGNIELVREGSR